MVSLILGTALIVLTWVLFPTFGLPFWSLVVLTVVGSILCLFGLLFTIYFWNMDMKLLSKVQPLLHKHYDKIKRNKKL